MFYVEVEGKEGVYCPVPEDVGRAGDAAIRSYVAANVADHVSAFAPGAPSAIVEAERSKLWHFAEVEAQSKLAASLETPAPAAPAPTIADEE